MDVSNIIVAVVSLVGTVVGSYLANNKTTAVIQVELNHLKDDIKDLDEKVHKHNNLVERMAIVEQSTKSLHRRVDELRSREHH